MSGLGGRPPTSEDVQRLLTVAVERRGVPVRFISAFGEPVERAFWIAVATDAQRDRLKVDPTLGPEFDRIFRDTGLVDALAAQFERQWADPRFDDIRETMEYCKHPGVEIESQETVNREEGGNWWYRMK